MIDHRTVKARVKVPTKRQREAAANLSAGMPIIKALTAAGYSENTARHGIASIPATVLALMPAECNLVELGRGITPEIQGNIARGRLALNAMRGKDAGSLSAKLLGSDKRVNMFTPEVQQGIVVINMPASFVENKAKLLESEE